MRKDLPARGIGCASTAERTRVLYELAQRRIGITSSECIALRPELFDVTNANTTLSWMARTGRVERRAVYEGKVKSRFFATPGVHLAQIESLLSAQLQIRNLQYRRSIEAQHERPCVRARLYRRSGEIVDGVQVGPKITVARGETFDARYQVDPASRIVGGFSDMGIGRYLDSDGVN